MQSESNSAHKPRRRYDVVVIGAGLAGAVAALAARALGAKVAVLRKGYGATAFSSGALDIANTPELRRAPRTVREHLVDIVQHRRRHPYGLLGEARSVEGIEGGWALLQSHLADTPLALAPLSLDSPNRVMISSLGAAIGVADTFPAHRHDLNVKALAIVSFAAHPYFDGPRVRRGVSRDLDDAEHAPVFEEIVVEGSLTDNTAIGMAKALDTEAGLDAFALQLKSALQEGTTTNAEALVLPPFLGLDQSDQVRARLSAVAECPVVEALAHTPSVPGLRLQRALEQVLRAADVELFQGAQGSVHDADGNIKALELLDGSSLECASVVLASGRFVSGGIRYDECLLEPIFDLDIVTEIGGSGEQSLEAMTRPLPTQLQPLMTAGVWADETLRPMRQGKAAHKNLFAAGMVLGGFASRFTLCADGVALASGFLAGRAAALQAGGGE